MILLDYSQVCISNLMMQISNSGDNTVDENLVRHMVLNSIRSYRSKFSAEYGELVICCDDKNFWRRDVFPYYKANRKKDREASQFDWTSIFNAMSKIKEELRQNMPYKLIQIERAEADDVIASLCHRYGKFQLSSEKILILSGDKDFGQLQKYMNVEQYSPIHKKKIIVMNPEKFLREHIMLGDKGDGVPNFLSDDDTFVSNKRQKSLSRKNLESWIIKNPSEFCDERMMRGYLRNESVVSLDKIPEHIQRSVVDEYINQVPANKSGIVNYFTQHNLTKMIEKLGDF